MGNHKSRRKTSATSSKMSPKRRQGVSGKKGKTPASRQPSSNAPSAKQGAREQRRGPQATVTTTNSAPKKRAVDERPSDTQWLRAARDLPADEPLKCAGCDFTCNGLDRMRVHLGFDHFDYLPIKCRLCQERVQAVDIPTFRVHCERLGHPRPYEAHAQENYTTEGEKKLFNATRQVVMQKMDEQRRNKEKEESDKDRVNDVHSG